MDDIQEGSTGGEQTAETPETTTEADPIKNLKAEVNRKMENITAQLQQQNQMMNQQLQAIIESVKPSQKQQAAENDDELADLMLTNPKEAVKRIKSQVANEVTSNVSNVINSKEQTTQVIAGLAAEYPELRDNNSDLARKAVELYNSLPTGVKNTPYGSELAIRQAAAALGKVPASFRKTKTEETEDFSVSANQGSKRPTKRSAELDDKTLGFAQLMGLDTSDPKVMESLKQRAQRTDWNRYK